MEERPSLLQLFEEVVSANYQYGRGTGARDVLEKLGNIKALEVLKPSLDPASKACGASAIAFLDRLREMRRVLDSSVPPSNLDVEAIKALISDLQV